MVPNNNPSTPRRIAVPQPQPPHRQSGGATTSSLTPGATRGQPLPPNIASERRHSGAQRKAASTPRPHSGPQLWYPTPPIHPAPPRGPHTSHHQISRPWHTQHTQAASRPQICRPLQGPHRGPQLWYPTTPNHPAPHCGATNTTTAPTEWRSHDIVPNPGRNPGTAPIH